MKKIPYVGKETHSIGSHKLYSAIDDTKGNYVEHRPTKYQGFAPPIFRTVLAADDFNGDWHASRRGAE